MSNRNEIMRKLRERAAQVRLEREAEAVNREQALKHVPLQATQATQATTGASNVFGEHTFNEKQMQAVELAKEGKEFCLIGSAGSGKTTTVKAIIAHLIKTEAEKQRVDPTDLKVKTILLGSFTNRAVKNIKKAVRDVAHAASFCSTFHKYLEYAPTYITVPGEDGELKDTMRFMPTYDLDNQLPETTLVVVEESSMVSLELFKAVKDAAPNAKFIFLGDLNQLPPVFGDAILGYKLNELPVVELTEIYRQAMDSPIIAFQHQFTLKGIMPGDTQLEKITADSNGALKFMPLKNERKYGPEDQELLAQVLARYFCKQIEAGNYDWKTDIILCPYAKAFGTSELNKGIAQYLSSTAGNPTYEIIAGIDKKYFAVGDFVIHNKDEYVVSEIKSNPAFVGNKPPQPESLTLDRHGVETGDGLEDISHLLNGSFNKDSVDLNMLLRATDGALKEDVEELKAQASHKITLRRADEELSNYETTLATRGEINALDLGYAITIHKAQGSEWDKVFLIMTNSHSPMLSRELLYTGMTRAKQQLEVIYSPQSRVGKKDSSIAKAIKRQRIPGNTWREKAKKFFEKQAKYKSLMDNSYEQAANG